MFKAIVAAMVAAFVAFPVMAGVQYNEHQRALIISGPTSSYQALMAFNVFSEHDVDTVYMYGTGGEMDAGLKIGDMIAKSGARVIVPSKQDCISACAFAALAAAEIHVDGRMLLHRPFTMYVPSMATVEDIAAHYGAAYLRVAMYLDTHGYPISVTKQIMENTSPCKFIALSDEAEIYHARDAGFFSAYDTDDKCGA